MRKIFLISKTVLIETIRRKDIYALVLLSVILIALIGSIKFFQIEGIGKFYREISLKIMNISTALAVIFISACQLPREFEKRTIYPLLAKPVSRLEFILGKFLGVLSAGIFCYLLFSVIFIMGIFYLKAKINWIVYLQSFYLTSLMLGIIISLSFMLSLIVNLDAAVTISTLLYLLAHIFTTTVSYLYDYMGIVGKFTLKIINFTIPQLSLFDLSPKIVHSEVWGPIIYWAMKDLSIYAFAYIFLFLFISYILFYKRAI